MREGQQVKHADQRSKPNRAAVGPRSAADHVIALQRTAGNAATARMLTVQRNGGQTTTTGLFEGDVAARNWQKAVWSLELLDKKQWAAALGFLTTDELARLDDQATRMSSSSVHKGITKALIEQHGASKERAKVGRFFGRAKAKYGKIKSGTKRDNSYEVPIQLTFAPDPNAVAAKEIGWIQTVRTLDIATGDLNEPRQEFSARATPSKWMLDRLEGKKHGWYGFANDDSMQTNVRTWRSNAPGTPAWMYDAPGWDVPNMSWEFEAAAVCREGAADTAWRKGDKPGFVYAVITWGFDTGPNGEVKTYKIKEWNKPTDQFGQAVGMWNAQARNELATMNDPGQLQLPAVQ